MANLSEACKLYFGTSDIYKILGLKKDATCEEGISFKIIEKSGLLGFFFFFY